MVATQEAKRTIRFRHEGWQKTLSFNRFRLSDREFAAVERHVATLLNVDRAGLVDLPEITKSWLSSIPRNLRRYLDKHFDLEQFEMPLQSLSDAIDLYADYRASLKTSVSTDEAVIDDCERLLACQSLSPDALQTSIERTSRSTNTRARIATRWRAFFRWSIDKGHLLGPNPITFGFTQTPRAKAEVKPEWFDAMVAASTSIEEKYWLRLLQWTGCRRRESLRVRCRNIDLERGTIEIRDTKRRVIRLNPLYREIRTYAEDLVHNRKPGQRVLRSIHEGNDERILRTLIARAGLKAWEPLFTSIRASRVNQLAADPAITPEEQGLLIGHSVKVKRSSYQSVSEDLLRRLGV